MPESRLERTRRAYDRVIDMGPYGCKLLDVGNPDNRALNALWERGEHWQESHHEAVERSFDANKAGPMSCEHRDNLTYDFTRRAYACPCGAFIPDL